MPPTIPLAADPWVGELSTSGYRFLKRMAAGGMGEVIAVEHEGLGERRVMKIVRAELSQLEDLVVRLRTEARVLRQLVSPHLVRVVDFGRTRSGRPFLVMEILEGETLKDAVRARGAFAPLEALEIAHQMLLGLECVHEAGIVHRDVKPDNVFHCKASPEPTSPRVVKLLDFGVAKVLHDDQRKRLGHVAPTAEGMLVGTPSFLSTEQALGLPVDTRTDIYATGGVLYYLLAGRQPFVRESQIELLRAHASEKPVAPSQFAPNPLAPATEALVLRAMEKRKEDRFETAADMRAAIEFAKREQLALDRSLGAALYADLMPKLDSGAMTTPRKGRCSRHFFSRRSSFRRACRMRAQTSTRRL